jgi:hypothetical protein
MSDQLHRCEFGPMCRGFVLEGGRRAPATMDQPTGLCRSCQRYVAHSMEKLPGDWCRLKLTLGEFQVSAGGGGRRPKPGSRVPLNVGTDSLMRDIVSVCAWAADAVEPALGVRAGMPLRNPSSIVGYKTITRAVGLVSHHVEKLLEAGDGVEICEQIVLLHRRAVRQLGETEQRERLHLPCPSCGRLSLVREVQDRRGRELVAGVETPEVVRCLSCDGGPNRDGTWTETEYQWLSTMVLSEREEHNVLKWLLAEANWRLEQIGKVADIMANDAGVKGFSPDSFAQAIRDYLPGETVDA